MTLSPRADQVRTARLVAATAARRSGVAEELLDDVRLAVAEACSRAVRRHAAAGSDELVALTFDDDDAGFTVVVVDNAGGTAPSAAALDLEDPDDLSLALIAGLIETHEIGPGPTRGSTQVSMTWPRSA